MHNASKTTMPYIKLDDNTSDKLIDPDKKLAKELENDLLSSSAISILILLDLSGIYRHSQEQLFYN